jgi:serine protease AprX
MNTSAKIVCPLCSDEVDKFLYRFHIDNERNVINTIKKQNPTWAIADGACSRCVDYYQVAILLEQKQIPEIGPQFPVRTADDFVVIPTPIRLNADPKFTGKGVTICFIDSGFYPHDDLVANGNRIKVLVDITTGSRISHRGENMDDSMWHGTMTTVVCAGNGFASQGLYKGIASNADLVLLKVQDSNGKITGTNIEKALEWVLENHRQYNIRIVNLSVGDDVICSYKESKIDQLAEGLINSGISVVAAAGNDESAPIKPPANALNVITVGGVDDENQLDGNNTKAYHSAYGKTIDDLMKPELVAHAIWLAAPVLPGRKQAEARILHQLLNVGDNELRQILADNLLDTSLDPELLKCNDLRCIRESTISRIMHSKFISADYMHVDGTSFAAPIVCGVIAQLLEANPLLTPAEIREILFSTAKRLETVEAVRQGYGIIQPRMAVLKVLTRLTGTRQYASPHIDVDNKTIAFYIRRECAQAISLAGTFNNWSNDSLPMEAGYNGQWQIEIPMLPAGRYSYKYLIDDQVWVEDAENPLREFDGFNGFNSILNIN